MKQVHLTQEEIEYLAVLIEAHEEDILKKQKKMPPLAFATATRTVKNIQDALETAELF